jgi:hypothetical protein
MGDRRCRRAIVAGPANSATAARSTASRRSSALSLVIDNAFSCHLLVWLRPSRRAPPVRAAEGRRGRPAARSAAREAHLSVPESLISCSSDSSSGCSASSGVQSRPSPPRSTPSIYRFYADPGAGLGLVFVPTSLVILNKVNASDADAAPFRRSRGRCQWPDQGSVWEWLAAVRSQARSPGPGGVGLLCVPRGGRGGCCGRPAGAWPGGVRAARRWSQRSRARRSPGREAEPSANAWADA